MTALQIQCLLTYLGYHVDVDGIMGAQTKSAIMDFQWENELTANGICGEQTSKKLIQNVVDGKFWENVATQPQKPASLGQYLQADGFYHIPKGINIQVSEHFRSGEFDCQCKRPECKWTIIHPKLLMACEDLRADVGGRPLTITDSGGSGYRCPAHNADPDVGGAPNSLHTLGLAADIHCIGVSPAQLAATAERRSNYGEIGVYSNFIHLGVFRPDGNHTRW